MNRRRQHQSRDRDGPVELLIAGGRFVRHRRASLGQEVLDDHLLDVAELLVRSGDRLKCGDALLAGLTDPDQETGREGDLQLAREAQGVQTTLRLLVGGQAVGRQIGQRLDHHALGCRDRAQLRQFVLKERTGIGVGQQASTFEHHLGGVGDVVDRRFIATRREPTSCFVVAQFWSFTEREERLGASRVAARLGHGHHFVETHIRRRDVGGSLGKRAVAAPVATELRQRDEDLGGIRDDVAEGRASFGEGRVR